jgi:hypothetical protein
MSTKTIVQKQYHHRKCIQRKKNMTHQAPLRIKTHFAHNQQANKPREK